MSDNCSIMLVCFNRIELTKRAFSHLLQSTPQLHNGTARLIIVDNGSEDSTPEYLTELKEKYSFISDVQLNPKNMGIGIGRSQCLKLANKYNDPYLSTIDNDVELPDNWLGKCLDVIKANPDFSIGVNLEGRKYPAINRAGKTFQFKASGNLGTACTVFPRLLHSQIGYFITEYGLYGEEDADFFFRARVAGWQMGYIEEMGVHFGEGALDEGEYREFKTKSHADNYQPFVKSCREYASGKRSVYIPFEELKVNTFEDLAKI